MEDIETLKKKYLGKLVYGGGTMNGVLGTVEEIKYEEEYDEIMFYIKDIDEGGYLHAYTFYDLKLPVLTYKYVDLMDVSDKDLEYAELIKKYIL